MVTAHKGTFTNLAIALNQLPSLKERPERLILPSFSPACRYVICTGDFEYLKRESHLSLWAASNGGFKTVGSIQSKGRNEEAWFASLVTKIYSTAGEQSMIIRELQLLVTENMLQLQVRDLRLQHRKENCNLESVRNSLHALDFLLLIASLHLFSRAEIKQTKTRSATSTKEIEFLYRSQDKNYFHKNYF